MKIKLGLMVLASAFITGCMDSMHEVSGQYQPEHFESEGEQLYFTGVDSSGKQMVAVGGHHHMQMHGGSCVTCHGAKKEGGVRMWPRFWVVAPALSIEALSIQHDDGHSHAAYDKRSLKRAIEDGIGPDGEPLHETMPRWKMSEASMHALIDYLLPETEHSH